MPGWRGDGSCAAAGRLVLLLVVGHLHHRALALGKAIGIEGVDRLESGHGRREGGRAPRRLLLSEREVRQLVGVVCEHERAPPAAQLGHVCTALAEGGQLRLGHVEPTEGLVERHGTHALEEARAPLLLSRRGGALVARGACPLEEQLVREEALLHVVEDELRGLLLPYIERCAGAPP